MPTELQSLLSAGFAVMSAQAPSTVVIGSHTFTGVCSPIQTSKRLQEQGFLDDSTGMVVLATADVTTGSIVDGSVMTVDGQSVRVTGILVTATDPTAEITFKHAR